MAGDPLLDCSLEDNIQDTTLRDTNTNTQHPYPHPQSQKNDQIVVYEDDLVMIQDEKNPERNKIGLVDYIADDDSDVEDDFVPSGHMRVLWLGEQDYETVPLSSVKVVDRATVAGDVVSLRDKPLGQKGQVIGQDLRLDVKYLDGREVCDISSVHLEHLQPVSIGAVVLHEGWVGRVEDTMFDIVVQFDEGQVVRIPSNLVVHDVVKVDNFEALSVRDGVPVFFPGVKVSVDLKESMSAEERRQVTWLQGRQKLTGSGKVLSLEPTMVEVDWLAFAMGVEVEARQPPSLQVRIDQVTKIMDHNHFYRWELGDYGYFPLPSPEPEQSQTTQNNDQTDEIQEVTRNKDQNQTYQPVNSPGSKNQKKIAVRLPKNKKNRMSSGFGRGFRRGQANPLEHVVNRTHQVVRITRTRQLVDVLWQDGTISRNLPSVDLLLPEYVSDQDLFPGDYIQEKLDQGDEPTPEKKLGVILKLDSKACTVKVRWLLRQQSNDNVHAQHGQHATENYVIGQQNFLIDANSVQNQNLNDDNQLTQNDDSTTNMEVDFDDSEADTQKNLTLDKNTLKYSTMKFIDEELSVYEIQEHHEYEFNWGDIVSNLNAKYSETDIQQRIGQVVGNDDGKVKIEWANGTKGLMFPDEIVMLSPEEGYTYDEDDDEDDVDDDEHDSEIVSNSDGSSWATDDELSDNVEHVTHEQQQQYQQQQQQFPLQSEQLDGQRVFEFRGGDGNVICVPVEYVDNIVSKFQGAFEEFVSQQSEEMKAHLNSDNFQVWVRKVTHEICSRMASQSNSSHYRKNVLMVKIKAHVGNAQTQELMTQFIQIHREQLMQTLSEFSADVFRLANKHQLQGDAQNVPNVTNGTNLQTTPPPRFWWSRKNGTNTTPSNAQNVNNTHNQENARRNNGFRNAFNWFGKRQRQSLPILEEEKSPDQLPDIQMDTDQPSTSGQSSAPENTPLASPSSHPLEDAQHAENSDLGDSHHAENGDDDLEEVQQTQNKQQFQGALANAFEFITAAAVSTGDPQHSPPMSDRDIPLQLTPLKNNNNQSNKQFQQFDIDSTCPKDHFYLNNRSVENISNNRQRMKRIQREWGMMQDGLPTSIWVRTYEDRTDVLRAAIAAADDTPYHDGLFFFDVYLSPDFPLVPPKIHYVSYGMKPNPNLYETGHVCLSLVNTWDGKMEERWNPENSSLLQLFVSIQGLVLVSKPYFNEAGFDRFIGQPESEKNAKLYNEQAFILNCKSMLNQMRNPPIGFEKLIKQHFQEKNIRILKGIESYMEPSSSVEYSSGLVLAANKDLREDLRVDWTTSLGFKKLLEKLRPKLQTAFSNLDEMDVKQQQFQDDDLNG